MKGKNDAVSVVGTYEHKGSDIDSGLNASSDSNQELLGLFTSTCKSLSLLIPHSPSRYPLLMGSEHGYCDVFKRHPLDGTKCGLCTEYHFGGVNRTFKEPFLFTIQLGVDQKVPKAQLIMTGYSDDLQGVKFNFPYTLLNGKYEYEMSNIELKVGGVNVKLKAVIDLSYEVDKGLATGRAIVKFDLVACTLVSKLCYGALPVSHFIHPLEMSEARIKALESLEKAQGEKGSSKYVEFGVNSNSVMNATSVQQEEL